MRIQRHNAVQVHPVSDHMHDPRGPFPREIFEEPEIVTDNFDKTEYGQDIPIGSTAQNNFKAPRILICSLCEARVAENKTGDHDCRN